MTKNCRVLITGACGSIGSSLVLKLLKAGNVVCAYDQSEDGLFKLDQKFKSNYKDNLKLFVGDVRDANRLSNALEEVDIVFHCAALKHVYLSEYNPFEAMKTNIIGTNNVVSASLKANVEKVIFTSSDKAVNPSSTMGATKLLAERLITAANNYAGNHKTRFASVRFGNVLNTNGSVLQIFRKLLDDKLPLTITSTDMSRFFITMHQAIDLCIYAEEHMVGGEIFVMNMGSCNIMSLAKAVSGSDSFDYIVIGNKSGEKLYEELVTETEAHRTIQKDKLYIIIPEMHDIVDELLMNQLKDSYSEYHRLTESIRSDDNMLTDKEVSNFLSVMDQ
jgi:UDP-N-acetylglucosamine 4,6-dehydratase/5-epimerase